LRARERRLCATFITVLVIITLALGIASYPKLDKLPIIETGESRI